MTTHVILCYGDSNTWGFDPRTKKRYAPQTRWTGILQERLGSGYRIVEEGLNSRTTVLEDPLLTGRNGREYLIPCLASQAPIDLVILMLGTNDFKRRFGMSAKDVSLGIASLMSVIGQSGSGGAGGSPPVLLLSPPTIGPLSEYAEFFEGAESRSKLLGGHCRRVADEFGCAYLDLAEFVSASEIDGVHLDPSAHITLAQAVAAEVSRILPAV
ncbi:MAG: SGNH/GDSL hydrolase family protein [Trueperaceae bacterium]